MKVSKYRIIIILSLVLSTTLVLSSCVSSSYPVRQAYMLQAKYPHAKRHAHNRSQLQVLGTTIVPQFATSEIVYRLSHLTYTTDYYNIFFIPPAQQITQITTLWLQHSGLFGDVVNASLIPSDYYLQSKVLQLYADNQHKPKVFGVLTMQFTLLQQTQAGRRIVFVKTYAQQLPVLARNTHGLIRVWNHELDNILTKLTRDIRRKVS